MVKIRSEAQKKLSELKTMKQKGGFTGPGTSWSFIAKLLGLIIGIFDDILIAQENLKRESSFRPLIGEKHDNRIKKINELRK